MRVAVYSGSFNPIHDGHVAVLRHLSEMFDRTYLVVSPQNPFKSEGNLISAKERFDAAVQFLCGHPELGAKADNIEFSLPSPQYTVDTLDALSRREPLNDFTLAIGADNLTRFNEWKDYRRVLKDYGIVVFPRNGIDMGYWKELLLKDEPEGRIVLVDAPEINISSTEIRESSEEDIDKKI